MDDPHLEHNFNRIYRGAISFNSPEIKVEVKPKIEIQVKVGDSLWNILSKLLEGKPEFSKLGEAGKTSVLLSLVDQIMQEPLKYGLRRDGSLFVGDKLDLSSLLGDEEKIKSFFDRAGRLSPEQERTILLNNKKIAEKVSPVKPIPKPVERPKLEIPKLEIPKPEPKPVPKPTPKIIERSMPNDAHFSVAVEAALKNEINNIYGESKLLGFSKKEGVTSEDWFFVRKLPMQKVLDYYTGDSKNSTFSDDVKDELVKEEKHHQLVKQIIGLIQETKGAIKPYENESVEEFLRRLGNFVMRNHLTSS